MCTLGKKGRKEGRKRRNSILDATYEQTSTFFVVEHPLSYGLVNQYGVGGGGGEKLRRIFFEAPEMETI